MKTYSQDLRERVVRACDQHAGSRQQIAALFGVSTAWIRRLLQRRRLTGSFAALPRGGARRVKMDAPQRHRLVVLVREQPDASLAELRDRLGVPVHLCTIGRTLIRLGFPVKKKSSGPPNTTVPTSAASAPPSAPAAAASTRIATSSSMKSGRTRR
jgi:transposase